MISVHEIRIGNRFAAAPCDAFPEGGEVTFTFSHLEWFIRNDRDITQYLSGISLTDELLKKMGFVFSRRVSGSLEFKTATYNSFNLIQDLGSSWAATMGSSIVNLHGYSQEMRFVHQLQDAYFSLVGKLLPVGT